jgi:hypothetical protein
MIATPRRLDERPAKDGPIIVDSSNPSSFVEPAAVQSKWEKKIEIAWTCVSIQDYEPLALMINNRLRHVVPSSKKPSLNSHLELRICSPKDLHLQAAISTSNGWQGQKVQRSLAHRLPRTVEVHQIPDNGPTTPGIFGT